MNDRQQKFKERGEALGAYMPDCACEIEKWESKQLGINAKRKMTDARFAKPVGDSSKSSSTKSYEEWERWENFSFFTRQIGKFSTERIWPAFVDYAWFRRRFAMEMGTYDRTDEDVTFNYFMAKGSFVDPLTCFGPYATLLADLATRLHPDLVFDTIRGKSPNYPTASREVKWPFERVTLSHAVIVAGIEEAPALLKLADEMKMPVNGFAAFVEAWVKGYNEAHGLTYGVFSRMGDLMDTYASDCYVNVKADLKRNWDFTVKMQREGGKVVEVSAE